MEHSSKPDIRPTVQHFAMPAFILGTFLFAWAIWLVPRWLNLQDAIALRHWVALGSFAPALMVLVLQFVDQQARQRWMQGRWLEDLLLSILAVAALYFICLPYASSTPFQVSLLGWGARVILFVAGGAVLWMVLRQVSLPQTVKGWLIWITAALAYPLLMLAGWGIWALATGSAQIHSPEGGAGRFVLTVLTSWVYLFLFGGTLGSEPGWRGWYFSRLLKHQPFWAAVLMTGGLEALWMVPLVFNGLNPAAGSLWQELTYRVLMILLHAVLLGWVYVRLQGNLFPVMLLRAGMLVTPLFIDFTPLSIGFLVILALGLTLNVRRIPGFQSG